MNFKAGGDKVLVKPIYDRIELPEGIIGFDSMGAKVKPTRGIVLSSGAGIASEPLLLEEGQEVYFKKGRGEQVFLKGESTLILLQDDILGTTN
jgi:co-chaperonin GroES (HSP10)